jgi:signal transduction histidine kinase
VNDERLLIRDVRWPAVGVLAAFLIAGAFTRHPRELAPSLIGIAVALAAGSLLAGYSPRTALLLALLSGAGVVLDAGARGNCLAWFGLCVLAFCCVIAAGPRLGALFLLAAVLVLASHMVTRHPDLGWLPWIAGVAVSAGAAALVARERTLLTELRTAQASLAERSRAEERNRIARDLHDVIAHSLTVSLLHVSSARLAVEHEPEEAARALAEAERLGRESLDEVRSIMGMLRTDADRGTTSPVPGTDGIPGLIERFQAAGAPVTLSVDGDLARVPATSGSTLYRILQEALTNATKHAPGCAVEVTVSARGARAELGVDSAGPPSNGRGMGLITMRERAEAVGGNCEAGPGGTGWRVRASVPISRRSAAPRPRQQ